jgi:peptidoglycan/xylan/chitin deacetylase (PgdA/CDA1 family)
MGSLKEAIRGSLSRAVVSGGLAAAGRSMFRKEGALILYGHRLTGDWEGYLHGLRPDWFAEQIAYLTRHYEVISLSTLVSCYEQRKPVPHNSVVLTFDDGFRDNLEQGLPVLRRYGVPATIFVVTGSMTTGELPWSQRLGYMIQKTTRPSLVFDQVRKEPFPLRTPAERRAAFLAVREPLIAAPRERREEAIHRIRTELEVEPPGDRMLSWENLRELMAGGVEIGAHTYSHPLLGRIPAEEARWEMEKSRDDLREHLGIERPPFCFPAGSCTAPLVQMVKALGFRSVFRPNPPHRINNLSTTGAFSLARVGLPNAPAVMLEAELDGPLHPLRGTLRRIVRRG